MSEAKIKSVFSKLAKSANDFAKSFADKQIKSSKGVIEITPPPIEQI